MYRVYRRNCLSFNKWSTNLRIFRVSISQIYFQSKVNKKKKQKCARRAISHWCNQSGERAHEIGGGENDRSPRVSDAFGVSSNTLSRASLFSFSLSSRKKRHLVQTITPVSGAIGHQQRVKAAAITNSDSLIPFIPSRAPSFSSHLPVLPPLRSFHSFSHFPFSVPPYFSLARSHVRATPPLTGPIYICPLLS